MKSAEPAVLTQSPSCLLPAPTLSPPWRCHCPEVNGVGKRGPLHPARLQPEWLAREEFASFQGVTTHLGLKSSWNQRVSASHCSLWKPRASLVCPSSSWLKGNCAAAGNSIKRVSKHFFHPHLMLNTPLLWLPKPCQHRSRTNARL